MSDMNDKLDGKEPEELAADVAEQAEDAAAEVAEQAAEVSEQAEDAVAEGFDQLQNAEDYIAEAEDAAAAEGAVAVAGQAVDAEPVEGAEPAEPAADSVVTVDPVAAGDAAEKPLANQTVKLPVFIGVAVAALVVGLVIGAFAFGAKSVSLGGKTTLTSDEVDTTIATYTYNGKTTNITARDVITQSGTLDSSANDDGTFDVPVATDVISYARTQVVVAAGEASGISVSDDDVNEYAEDKFNTSDFSTIASTYSVDEDVAKEMIRESALMAKMREKAVTTQLPEQPTAPTSPSSDATDTPTAEYASYIIALAGDEWDSTNNTWARTDGDYYAALSAYSISNDSATYAAAQAAYYVAYNAYSTAYSSQTTEWSDYCNNILSNATINIGSLSI